MDGPDRDAQQITNTKGQMKEQPGEKTIPPAKDWGSQDRKATNPGLDHPGLASASMQGPSVWIKVTSCHHLGRGGPTPGTGRSGDETSSPGGERPGQHKVEKEAAAAGTSIQDTKGRQKGASDPVSPEAAQGGGEDKGSETRVPEYQGEPTHTGPTRAYKIKIYVQDNVGRR